ncbi:hypothetical protein G6F68_017129 [Rhizopus microsporus]|nr:hypothetical protein G6F68_017129 [Rhizopus microsporus]
MKLRSISGAQTGASITGRDQHGGGTVSRKTGNMFVNFQFRMPYLQIHGPRSRMLRVLLSAASLLPKFQIC